MCNLGDNLDGLDGFGIIYWNHLKSNMDRAARNI